MPALNFKNKFVNKILSGVKCQTVRRIRKQTIKIGQPLYLYTGMRTKNCKKIKDTYCIDIKNIFITKTNSIYIDGLELNELGKCKLAFEDGFETVSDFILFFYDNYGLPFSGIIIYWLPPNAAELLNNLFEMICKELKLDKILSFLNQLLKKHKG